MGVLGVRLRKLIIAAIVVLAFVLLVGCNAAEPSEDAAQPVPDPGGALEGTSWNCMTFNVGGTPRPVPADIPITAEFGADGTLSGNASVNTYSTTYKADGGNLTIDPNIVTTKMAGSDEAMKQESDYLTTLVTVASYQIDDKNGQLVLFGPAQNTVARYEPAK